MKTKTILRYLSLLLMLLGSAWLSQVRADPITITNTILSGPNTITCGAIGQFTLTLTGTGTPGEISNLLWSVFQDEFIDDLLIDETGFTVIVPATGNWTFTIEFMLQCTGDCILIGRDGSSDDNEAQVFGLIEFPFGTDAGRSQNLNVRCEPVPEPTTILLLGTGLAGVTMKMRKRLKCGKSGQGSQ